MHQDIELNILIDAGRSPHCTGCCQPRRLVGRRRPKQAHARLIVVSAETGALELGTRCQGESIVVERQFILNKAAVDGIRVFIG